MKDRFIHLNLSFYNPFLGLFHKIALIFINMDQAHNILSES